MAERNFMQLLQGRWDRGFFVCVGLDSNAGQLPVEGLKIPRDYRISRDMLAEAAEAYRKAEEAQPGSTVELDEGHLDILASAVVLFNRAIIGATHDLAVAFKPNIAFYEALGEFGMGALEETIEYVHGVAPDVPVILDWKRGDIGPTNSGYVMARQLLDANAITISPYLGYEALAPFFADPTKGVFVLCKTSNSGAGEFQDLMCQLQGDLNLNIASTTVVEPGRVVHLAPLYQILADRVATRWNDNDNCGLVVGATYPEDLARVRLIVGDGFPILIPGIGAQGGELEATVAAGKDSKGQGVVINSSRGIIFASSGSDFAERAREETQKLHDAITAALAA